MMLLLWSAGNTVAEEPALQAPETHGAKTVEDYDSPPKPVHLSKPKYPRKAFDNRIEGKVIVQILINAKGEVEDPQIVESVPGLDEAALKCVKKWRFKPAMKAGKPVATLANAPIMFRIK